MSLPEDWQHKAHRHRRTVTAVTLSVGVVVLVVMGMLGLQALQEPFGREEAAPECPAEDVVRITEVARNEVQVSVFNAGGKQGAAGRTLERLEGAGFRPGEVGNAPEGTALESAVVYTTREDDDRARLVALFLGDIPVQVVEDDFGPGVDVFLGKQAPKVNTKAPRRIELAEPIVRCDRS